MNVEISNEDMIEQRARRIAARNDSCVEMQFAKQARDWANSRCQLTPCPRCGERYSSLGADPCPRCFALQENLRLRALSKSDALAHSGIPDKYRLTYAWMGSPDAWPLSQAGARVDTWVGGNDQPWAVTFTGWNGSGKSCRAGELLYRAFRHEPRQLLWVCEPGLTEEALGWPPFPKKHQALHAEVLAIDELGITRDRRKIDAAWAVMQEVVSYRYDRHRPTIITTHRRLIDGEYPISSCSPSLFDRIKCGHMCQTPNKSWR